MELDNLIHLQTEDQLGSKNSLLTYSNFKSLLKIEISGTCVRFCHQLFLCIIKLFHLTFEFFRFQSLDWPCTSIFLHSFQIHSLQLRKMLTKNTMCVLTILSYFNCTVFKMIIIFLTTSNTFLNLLTQFVKIINLQTMGNLKFNMKYLI